jgi:hypothetical protein
LIAGNGCSGEYATAFSNKLHPCSVLVKINNAAYKPLKLALRELMGTMITTQNLLDVE